jgi:hypothetical protein
VALYDFRCFGPSYPWHLEGMTHSESVHLCAELKTGILAVPTDRAALEHLQIDDHHCHIMLNYYCYNYDHVNVIRYPYYN